MHVLALLGALGTAQSHADLVLLIHPYRPASELIVAYTPFADYLGKKIGQRITIRISKDYQAHFDTIVNDEFDIAYMGPAPYAEMAEKYPPKQLLARQTIHDSRRLTARSSYARTAPSGRLRT
jgi:ABC-type phosphate/phosphonate transport system substrate-binding protein